jgi:hypothetical protein
MGLTGQILLPDWSEGGKESWEVEMNRIGLGNDCIEYKTSFFTLLLLQALLKDQLPCRRPLVLLPNHPIAHHAFKYSHASITFGQAMIGPMLPDFRYWSTHADVCSVIDLEELSTAYPYP